MDMFRRESGQRWLNIISVLMLLPVCLIVLFRFGPTDLRHRMDRLAIYAWGDATGCSLSEVFHGPRKVDDQVFERFEQSLDAVETTKSLIHWTSSLGDFWSPSKTDVHFVLLEHAANPYQSGRVRVRKGDIVLDCGANIGVFTRRALDDGAEHVVAIDPSPLNVAALEKNFAEEIADGRVTVVPKALWHEPGTMTLKIYENSLLDSLVMEDRFEGQQISEVEVELVTIDTLVHELNLDTVDFIKMDIEGAEENALKGAAETLRSYHPNLAIATENLPGDVRTVPAAVAAGAADYRVENGICRAIRPGVIRPEILYFTTDATQPTSADH